MIYLQPEIASGLGEKTYWIWGKEEFPNSTFESPTSVSKNDVLLRYSTKGPSNSPENTIALLFELHPEMRAMLGSNAWDHTIAKIEQCGRNAARRVVASELMVPYYQHLGPIDVLPIGVDTDLFAPLDKQACRIMHGLPLDRRIGLWCGTSHAMKGPDRLKEYASQHPDIFWIVVSKSASEAVILDGARNYILVPQHTLAELMSASDFFLSCGRLRPLFMIEWEALSCNLPLVILDGMQKDFVPSANPRDDIFRLGWDRHTAKKTWLNYIEKFVESKK